MTSANEASIDWWIANIAQSFVFWPVPVFFMVSGFLLLAPKEERFNEFYKKRAVTILIPTLLWATFYLVWGYYVRHYPANLNDVRTAILSGNISDHLYFIVALAGIYIFVPFYRLFFRHIERLTIATFGLIMSLFWIMDYGINRLFLNQWGGNSANLHFAYLSYFILGYGFRLYFDNLSEKNVRLFFSKMFILGVIMYISFKYLEAAYSVNAIPYYYSNSYFSIPLFLLSVSVFPIMLHSKFIQRMGESKLIQTIAYSSFGIYLIHVAILDTIHRLIALPYPSHILLIIAESTGVFFVSFLIILGLKITPGLSWTVGGSNI